MKRLSLVNNNLRGIFKSASSSNVVNSFLPTISNNSRFLNIVHHSMNTNQIVNNVLFVNNIGQQMMYHTTPIPKNVNQGEDEAAYLDRVAEELEIKWSNYFKARILNSKKERSLRTSKTILVAKEEDLGIDQITKPVNYEIPEEFTHYRLIRVSDGTMVADKIDRESAEEIAFNEGLDLILVVDSVNPPIVKLGDYVVFLKHAIIKDKLGQLKELEKELEEKKTKEIRFSANIEPHDLDVKMKKFIKFLVTGKKVKILCFRVENEEQAFQMLKDFVGKAKEKIADEFPGMDLKKAFEEDKPFKQRNEYMLTIKMRDDFLAKAKKANKQ